MSDKIHWSSLYVYDVCEGIVSGKKAKAQLKELMDFGHISGAYGPFRTLEEATKCESSEFPEEHEDVDPVDIDWSGI